MAFSVAALMPERALDEAATELGWDRAASPLLELIEGRRRLSAVSGRAAACALEYAWARSRLALPG